MITGTDPPNLSARLCLATAYERLRNWQRGIDTFRVAVNIGVAADQIPSRVGKAYLRMHELHKGVEALENASRINPTSFDNLPNLGTAYLQLGRLHGAEEAFKEITV